MQSIEMFYESSEYTIDAVREIIGRNYPGFKYYGKYTRKTPDIINIYRFYIKLNNGQKKRYRSCLRLFCQGNRNPRNFS